MWRWIIALAIGLIVLHGILLIPATLVPWPREPPSRNPIWCFLIVAVRLLAAGLIGGLLVAFEGSLPPARSVVTPVLG